MELPRCYVTNRRRVIVVQAFNPSNCPSCQIACRPWFPSVGVLPALLVLLVLEAVVAEPDALDQIWKDMCP